MESVLFIQDLAIVMIVAAVVSMVFHRFNQPPVIGYILVGLIIGPHTPPFTFIHNESSIRTLADLGVIFLMFSLGLDFNFRKLRSVGATAVFTAIVDVVIMVWIGYSLGRFFGWGRVESIFLGAIICDSSTTILAKVINDLGWGRRRFAELVFGMTIVEDLLAIVLIALLNGLGSGGVLSSAVLIRTGELGVFLVAVVTLGLLFVPRLLGILAKYHSDELLLITVLGLCFGVSLVAVKLEFSLAMGAFLMGAVTAEARAIDRIEKLVTPLRHMFSAIFFVTIGLMVQPALMLQYWAPILVITSILLVAKTVNCTTGAFLAGQSPGISFRAGLGMAQIGEFAYIIAAMGITMGLTDDFLYQVAVAVSFLTTLLNPYLLRGSDRMSATLKRLIPSRLYDTLGLYTNWLERVQEARGNSVVRQVVRRSIRIVLINAALIAAVYLVGAFLAGREYRLFPSLKLWAGAGAALIWLLCALVAAPLYVSSLRKIQALGMILSETCIPPALTSGWALRFRLLIANAVLLLGILGLGLLTFALSTTLLPSWKELVVLLAVLILVMWLRWRRLIAVYARAQSSIQGLFAREARSVSAPSVQQLLSVHLDTLVLTPRSAAVGRRILDLQLRAKSGANAVSIERGAQTIVNPDPSETFQAGDRVLLLGTPEQLEKAGRLMN